MRYIKCGSLKKENKTVEVSQTIKKSFLEKINFEFDRKSYKVTNINDNNISVMSLPEWVTIKQKIFFYLEFTHDEKLYRNQCVGVVLRVNGKETHVKYSTSLLNWSQMLSTYLKSG